MILSGTHCTMELRWTQIDYSVTVHYSLAAERWREREGWTTATGAPVREWFMHVLTRACTGCPLCVLYSYILTSQHQFTQVVGTCFDKEFLTSSPTEDSHFSPCTCRRLAQGTTLSKPDAHAGSKIWILWLLHPYTGWVRRGGGRLLQQVHQLGNGLWIIAQTLHSKNGRVVFTTVWLYQFHLWDPCCTNIIIHDN